MDLDRTRCYCFHIPKHWVVNFTRQRRPKRASQLSECFGAGTGCGWCVPLLIRIHEEIVGDAAVEAEDVTAEQYEAMRARYRADAASGRRTSTGKSGALNPPTIRIRRPPAGLLPRE